MEVSPVHESSLLDEQREDVRESSVDLFDKPIERFHDCSGLISQISHVNVYSPPFMRRQPNIKFGRG